MSPLGLSPARRRALARRRPIADVRRFADAHWVVWAHVPGLRGVVLRRRAPTQRPVLVLGVPRGGTSWVGQVLGSATGCCYLREPLTQSRPPHPDGYGWVEDGPVAELPELQAAARDAFAGLPRFARRINPDRSQFAPRRRVARVVVKEVNPLWFDALRAERDPLLVHVVRHPAAVAASWAALGWLRTVPWPPSLAAALDAAALGDDPWARHGALQAALHERVRAAAPERVEVTYEPLARHPSDGFRSLFATLGLPWDARIGAIVADLSAGEGGGGPYATRRDSAAHVDTWRTTLDAAQQAAVRRGWEAMDPAWYRDPADW